MGFTARLVALILAPGLALAGNVSVPLFFLPNSGLADPQFRYLVQTPRFNAAFGPELVAFQLQGSQVQLRFPGAEGGVKISGVNAMSARVNFLTGRSPDAWNTQLPTYGEIVYHELYSGIDLVYLGSGAELKSEFHVAPGKDPARIQLRYSQPLTIDDSGALIAHAGETELREKAPEVYQETAHGRITIEARYVLRDANTAAFELGPYDSSKPLIIDPVISYSTYLGGSSAGAITSTAVDDAGNLYIAGWTAAADFPVRSNYQVAGGGVDVVVVKLNSTGTALIYATYLGGSGADQAFGIAVDSSGRAVITGSTASPNFPLASPIIATLAGGKAAFVTKLNAAGNGFVFSTYLAGTTYDAGTAIALDSSGNAWVAGDTQSANFPMVGALQSTYGGGTDIFISKITPTGTLAFSTFLGGSAAEHAGGIAVAPEGTILVVGGTYSTNFPVRWGTQINNAGNQDAFYLGINPSGTLLLFSDYLGGSGADQANGIAVNASGDICITGATNSPNFPITTGAIQTAPGGLQDVFVRKMNFYSGVVAYSTYLGGSGFDWGSGVAIDTAGNAYITGYTSSLNFPTTGSVQPTFTGGYDAFVSMLNTTGGVLAFSTYYGGSGIDQANTIAIDASGNMYIGGQTNSTNLPLQTPYQSSNVGGATGWVARLGVTPPQPQTPAVVSVTPSAGSGANVVFTAVYSDTGGGSALSNVSLLVNTGATSTFGCMVTYTIATNLFSLANDTASGASTTVPGGTNIQNSQCTLNGTTSAVALSGNTLTLTLSLYFQPGFSGAHSIYLSAADAGTGTGLVSRGSWSATIPAPQPSVTSVAPSSGTGFNQTFVFTFGDASSANNLADVAVLFSPNQSSTNSCYIVVDLLKNTIALLWNNALGSNSKPIGSATLLNNSQCSIGANNIVLSGQSLALTMAISFTAPFNGAQNVYMQAAEVGINTGWIQKGTYNVLAMGSPQATSVVPNAGSGTGQRFSFTMTDLGGSANLGAMAMLFNSSLNLNNACSLVWDGARGTISLAWDVQTLGATPVVPGTNQTASNAQCTLNAANSTIAYSATTVTVTVDVAFNGSFNGPKNIYLFAAEVNSNSGWANVGTWTVTSGSPVANSVSPSSGAGHFPTFTFNASDSANQSNITSAAMLFTTGAPSNTANACYVVFNRTAGTVGLYDNSGTILSTKAFGASSPLSNSQCAVGYAAIGLPGGNNVQFILQVLFNTGPFSGPKTVYFDVNEPSATTGWVASGTWTTQ